MRRFVERGAALRPCGGKSQVGACCLFGNSERSASGTATEVQRRARGSCRRAMRGAQAMPEGDAGALQVGACCRSEMANGARAARPRRLSAGRTGHAGGSMRARRSRRRAMQGARVRCRARGSCRRAMRGARVRCRARGSCRRAMRARSKSGHATVRKRRTERGRHGHGGSMRGRAGHAGGRCRARRPCQRAMRARSKSGHAAVRKRRTERGRHGHRGSAQGTRAMPEGDAGRKPCTSQQILCPKFVD